MTLPSATVGTTDEELDVLLERNRLDPEPDPPAIVSAEYNEPYDLVVLKLDNKSRLVIPREQMRGLEGATTGQLAHIEIFGSMVAWPDLDVDHYLPELLEGRYASEKWKQAHRQDAVAA